MILKNSPITDADQRTGVLYGIGAYGAWALFPLYFTSVVGDVLPLNVLAHRVVWSLLFLSIILSIQGRWPEVKFHLAIPRVRWLLLVSTIAIAVNWYSFIWAMTNEQILQASLGYFMNPLMAVLLGVLVLAERLRGGQIVAVVIATISVAVFVIGDGHVPYVALIVGVSFALYGLVRKLAVVPPLVGLWIETAILLPFALVIVALQLHHHATTPTTYALLSISGPMTAIPLLWFAAAARRLKLATIGFLQYLSPTGHFLLGRYVYHEPFNRLEFGCFVAIWIALVIFTVDSIHFYRTGRLIKHP